MMAQSGSVPFVSELVRAARRILAELLDGQRELLAELQSADSS
ncbi:hypothetical protein GCM10009838_23220 [Catenulispora subtropica]|uniref:Uncharacterized protein n=1 Tax=Catenulispora subtropica TaxID=450798 RepID=A0ABP5CQ05_9ACTN